MTPLSRRRLLQGAGSLAGMAAFARLFQAEEAHAQTAPPLRFVAIFTPHGMVPEHWVPRGGELDFDLDFEGSMLRPLQAHRSRLLVLDGLDYRVLYERGNTGHEGGPVTFLTGSQVSTATGEELPLGDSLDQRLATALGAATRFRSLALNAYEQFGGQHVYNTISFRADGSRVPFERSPAALYARLFGDMVDDSSGAAAALARKRSLLDFVLGDAQRLRTRLGGPERSKLDAHLQALRDIERRLGAGYGAGCVKPPAPPELDVAQLGELARVPELTQLHLALVARAFACDLTRFVTFTCSPPSMPWLGITQDIHNDIAHVVDSSDAGERSAARLRLSRVQQWHAQQVAGFLDLLAAIPEGSGSVLDNTLVLWGNELGNPAAHASLGIPTVLAGGAGGRFRMGRFLRLRPAEGPLEGWSGPGAPAPRLVPHNRLLVSIAQAFGLETNTFGHPDYSGTLAGLT